MIDLINNIHNLKTEYSINLREKNRVKKKTQYRRRKGDRKLISGMINWAIPNGQYFSLEKIDSIKADPNFSLKFHYQEKS